MDVDLARTFLEIVNAGSFVRAAERLHVSQTAVSARIRSLERQIGRAVFIRNKAGATLTPAGKQFLRYAPIFIQVWERARHHVAVPTGHRTVLAVGCEPGLWDPLLLRWLVWMKKSASDIALRIHIGLPEGLIQQVAEGVIDIAIMYTPKNLPGLQVERLLEEKLVLVTTDPRRPRSIDAGYVYVDWGPGFAASHHMIFPEQENPGLYVGLGRLGLSYILEVGGSGYFRLQSVRPYLENGQLHLVRSAPEISYPAYIVYSASAEAGLLTTAVKGLREVSQMEPRKRRGRRPPRGSRQARRA
jgi:LysR family transcriptional regulator, flagellar master operon regulator